MRELARLADEAREALEMRDARRLGELMNANLTCADKPSATRHSAPRTLK